MTGTDEQSRRLWKAIEQEGIIVLTDAEIEAMRAALDYIKAHEAWRDYNDDVERQFGKSDEQIESDLSALQAQIDRAQDRFGDGVDQLQSLLSRMTALDPGNES